MSGWKSLRYRVEAGLCRALAWVVPRLPRGVCLRLGHALGELAFRFDRRGRRVGLENLVCAFGKRFSPVERLRILRLSYRNFARTMLDLFWSVRLTQQEFHRWVELEGYEPLKARLAVEKKGAIFLLVHQGNWEWANVLAGLLGHRLAIVTAYFKNPHLTQLFRDLREHSGEEVIPQEKSLLRMLKIVKRNGLTGMMVDLTLPPSKAATVIRAFPDPATGEALQMCVPLLHTILAQRVGTPLYPIETISRPDGGVRIVVHPPLAFAEGATSQEIAQLCWDTFEPTIRARPEQWLWPYKHFRYRPKAAARPYPAYANPSGRFEKLLQSLHQPPAAPEAVPGPPFELGTSLVLLLNPPPHRMKSFLSLGLFALAATLFTGCASTGGGGGAGGSYHVSAYAPHNPGNVTVKVSTSTQHIYVMEGDRCLMAVQGCVGEAGKTPLGNHHVIAKQRDKRSGSFGFTSSGGPADIHKGQSVSVGYPMGFWTEFEPGYGFHEGFVWSIPRTHGCIRLHKEAAARLFALVHVGTPVNIQTTQPEDATVGKTVRRLDQRNDPDPSPSRLMSPSYFQDPPGPLLIQG